MISVTTILRSVHGTWRLAHGDPHGLSWFDTSPRGVWQSFWGPALVLPGVLALRTFDGAFESTDLVDALLVQLIAYVIGCTAYILVVAALADGIGRSRLLPRFIVAYNWSAPLQIAVLLPVGLASWLAPGSATALIGALVTLGLLIYQGYVTHVALAVSPAGAGMMVMLDLLIGALIQSVAGLLA